jgi:serine/threonine protein kinase
LQKLKQLVVQSQPRWFNKKNAGDIYYSIFEKWDTDLYHYLDDDEVRRFHNIPRPVIERFAERIRKLHRRAVVHLDLAPKNVLVRVQDDVVQEMVLADFGLSRPRISWYFDTSEKFRESIATYYAEDWTAGVWADYLNNYNSSFREWIVNEPFNADWCLVGAYAVGHKWQAMIDRLLKMPPDFNFEIPWDESGWLTAIVGDGKTTVRVEVHGLMSLSKLRQTLKDSFAMNRLQFIDTTEEVIAVKDEKAAYPSSVLREFRGEWFINLDARGVSKAE